MLVPPKTKTDRIKVHYPYFEKNKQFQKNNKKQRNGQSVFANQPRRQCQCFPCSTQHINMHYKLGFKRLTLPSVCTLVHNLGFLNLIVGPFCFDMPSIVTPKCACGIYILFHRHHIRRHTMKFKNAIFELVCVAIGIFEFEFFFGWHLAYTFPHSTHLIC